MDDAPELDGDDPGVDAEPEMPRGSADPAPEKLKTLTKSELYAMYKGKGPHVMNLDILSEDILRAHACIIIHIAAPLHEQYKTELKANSSTLSGLLTWVANRASGGGLEVSIAILRAQTSNELFDQMRCTPHSDPPAEYNYETLQEDIDLTECALSFSIELAANTAWAQLLYSLTFPLATGVFLSRNPEVQEESWKRLRFLTIAILLAEKKCTDIPGLKVVLQDLAFQQEPFAREIMFLLKKSTSWDSDEMHTVRRLMIRFFGSSSSTKEILESTFGHLADIVARAAKNKRSNSYSLWLYTTSSEYVKASGMKQSLPTAATWARLWPSMANSTSPLMKRFQKAFRLGTAFPLPTGEKVPFPKNAAGVQSAEWRTAGPLSHYRSSAAAAYLAHDVRNNFGNVHKTWAGQMNGSKTKHLTSLCAKKVSVFINCNDS